MTAAATAMRMFGGPRGWLKRALAAAVVLLVVGHVLALIGLDKGMPPAPWGDEALRTERLLTRSAGVVWMPWKPAQPYAAFPATLARFTLPALLLWLLGELAAIWIVGRARQAWMRRQGNHTVVVGFGPLARALAAAWIDRGRAVMVLSAQPHERTDVERLGAAFLLGNAGNRFAMRQCGLAAASRAAFVSSDDNANLELALRAAELARSERSDEAQPLELLVHIEDPFLRASFSDRLQSFGESSKVAFRVISTAQISARRLLRDLPPERWRALDAPLPCLWIVGLTVMAEELAIQALRVAIHGETQFPRIAFVGRDAEAFKARLLARWPGLTSVGDVHFLAREPEEVAGACADAMATIGLPNGIYFCLPSAVTTLAAALAWTAELQRISSPVPPLYLWTLEGERHELHGQMSAHPWFHGFGEASDVAAEILSGEGLDDVARSIHESYLSESLERGEALGTRRSLQHWPRLAEDLKDDNRHVADHNFVKLRDRSYALAQGVNGLRGWPAEDLEALARLEHVRWMRQRLLAGWRAGTERDDGQRIHPDLVSYDALGETRRELDRDIVRQLPALFARLGYGIVPEVRVLVTGPSSPWAFLPAFDDAIDSALAKCFDTQSTAACVLWVLTDSAMAWRVAERWLEGGGSRRLGVLSAEPAWKLLARQPNEQIRRRVFDLLSAASEMVMVSETDPNGDSLRALAQARAVSSIRLSIDGRDLAPAADAWGIDSTGRVLFSPTEA